MNENNNITIYPLSSINNDHKIQPGSLKTISDNKLINFAVGQQKKSRFQKLKEEKEIKKKLDDKQAAIVYEEFVKSFANSEDSNAFVKSSGNDREIYNFNQLPSSVTNNIISNNNAISINNNNFANNTITANINNNINSNTKDKAIVDIKTKEIASKKRVLGFVSDPNELEDEIIKPIVKRNKQIDNFLLEIKSKHGNNDDQDIDDHLLESNDNTSTNLYIGHLAPTVTEEELFKLFSKYGDINGIKILWPRSEDEKLRKRNCGFVSYMKRIDAQNAMMHLHEYEIHDQAITVGWGKPVKLNTTPMTLQSLTNPLINANVQPYAVPSINPITNQLVTTNKWDITPNDNIIEVDYKPGDPSIQIRVPENDDVVYLIDTLAKVVAVDGDQIEKIIKQREESNPNFTFLRISDSLEGWYYRWRTYSYIMGDSDRTWRTKPFQLMPGGTFIIPPPNNNFTSSNNDNQIEESTNNRNRSDSIDSTTSNHSNELTQLQFDKLTGAQIEKLRKLEKMKRNIKSLTSSSSNNPSSYLPTPIGCNEKLTDKQLIHWNELLSSISLSNKCVRSCMVFAYDHILSCEQIISTLRESILNTDDPPTSRIAKLYVLSDILYNSSSTVKHAGNYRSLVQAVIPEIFDSFGSMYRSITGRMTAKQVEDRIKAMLTAWSDWSIFPSTYLISLESMFYTTESDIQAQQQALEQIIELSNQSANDITINYLSTSLTIIRNENVDTLKKKARLLGIWTNHLYNDKDVDPIIILAEIHLKLLYIETNQRLKTNKDFKIDSYIDSTIDNKVVRSIDSKIDSKVDNQVDSFIADIDGMPIDDIDGQPIDEDIDGDPIDDDVDGDPIDDDIDGQPI